MLLRQANGQPRSMGYRESDIVAFEEAHMVHASDLELDDDAELAKEFIEDAVLTQGISRDNLTIHADRGGAMRSKSEPTHGGPRGHEKPLASPREQ